MTERLCDDECDFEHCPDEPCHCEFGMEILRERAELRMELARENQGEV